MIGIVLLILIVLAVIFVIGMYNSLVQLRVRADSPGPTSTCNSNGVTT